MSNPEEARGVGGEGGGGVVNLSRAMSDSNRTRVKTVYIPTCVFDFLRSLLTTALGHPLFHPCRESSTPTPPKKSKASILQLLISRLRLPSRMLRIFLFPPLGSSLSDGNKSYSEYALQCSSSTMNCCVLFGPLKAPTIPVPSVPFSSGDRVNRNARRRKSRGHLS